MIKLYFFECNKLVNVQEAIQPYLTCSDHKSGEA